MPRRGIEALQRLEELLERGRGVTGADDLDELLTHTAQAIASILGFGTVVINLYRPAWDDFEVTAVWADDPDIARDLVGSTNRLADLAPLMDERFRHDRAYLARMSADELHLGAVHVPDLPPGDLDTWGSTDWLLVPIHGAGGKLLGILSVDQPVSGRLPSDDDIRLLCSFTSVASLAVENAQRAATLERHRDALEHLFSIAGRLVGAFSLPELLDRVCEGISTALGFEVVAVALIDSQTGSMRLRSALGLDLSTDALAAAFRIDDVAPILDPCYETCGCYLVPDDVARARSVGGPDFTSRRNGAGPEAWNHHWLLVPLIDRNAHPIGLVWVDEPSDRLLPSQPKLKALRTFADLASVAIESHSDVEALAQGGEVRRQLLRQIVEVGESERRHMADELHDSTIQRLSALQLRVATTVAALERDDLPKAREMLGAIAPTLSGEIARLRALMVELRPPVLDRMGVMAALADYAGRLDTDARIEIPADIVRLPQDRETVMYRVAQEAILNAVRHAGAGRIDVTIASGIDGVELEIRDDGVGFDPEQVSASGHFGVVGMRERAEMVSGTVSVSSTPGGGTTVRLVIPTSVLATGEGEAHPEPDHHQATRSADDA